MSDTLELATPCGLLLCWECVLRRGRVRARDRARRNRLEPRPKQGSRRARAVLDLIVHPAKFIGTIQIGITLFWIALGAIGQPLLTTTSTPRSRTRLAYALAFLILTFLSVALGELVPKALALAAGRADREVVAIPLGLLQTIVTPFIWLLQVSANAVRGSSASPAPAGEPPIRRRTSATSSPGAEDAGVIATARRRCSTRSSTSRTRKSTR